MIMIIIHPVHPHHAKLAMQVNTALQGRRHALIARQAGMMMTGPHRLFALLAL
jgi:hypothetical protein